MLTGTGQLKALSNVEACAERVDSTGTQKAALAAKRGVMAMSRR